MTSAIAVPALAGIPVTHRGLTHEFVVVSGHLPPGHPDSLVDWPAIGRLRGTVVVLMGVETAPAIAARWSSTAASPDTPVADRHRRLDAAQRTIRTTLGSLAETMAAEVVRPPAVWVVGDVVDLAAPAAAPRVAALLVSIGYSRRISDAPPGSAVVHHRSADNRPQGARTFPRRALLGRFGSPCSGTPEARTSPEVAARHQMLAPSAGGPSGSGAAKPPPSMAGGAHAHRVGVIDSEPYA